jgi:Ca-activated chloride channel family protein
MKTAARVAIALAAALPAIAAAPQVFRGGTDLVLLSVSVLDGGGHPVPNLTREDFTVMEDGLAQDISVFERDPQPIAMSLLLDTSASMDTKLPVAQEAALGLIRRLGPRDVAQVIDFDSRAVVSASFTRDQKALEAAVRSTRADGSTSLYDALYIALTELKRVRVESSDEIRRQAVIVLSDGEDTSSLESYDNVLDLSKETGVAVYAIALRSKDDDPHRGFSESDYVLRTLSQDTGGRVFFVNDVTQLRGIYGQIADELASQYTIGYVSKNIKRDGAWRRVMIRMGKPNMVARTKAGYFAPAAK